MERVKWAEKDVINKSRIKNLSNTVFGWIDGNILYNGLLEEMSDHEFKLYGFYNLAGDSLYCLSNYGRRYICKLLKTTPRELIKAREELVKKDLIAYKNREFVNSKGLRYKKTLVQVLSLPIDKIVITRRRKTQRDLAPLEKGLQRYGLTKGYGKFPSEPEQDQLIVKVMRDLNLSPEVQESIKVGLRVGKIRIKK